MAMDRTKAVWFPFAHGVAVAMRTAAARKLAVGRHYMVLSLMRRITAFKQRLKWVYAATSTLSGTPVPRPPDRVGWGGGITLPEGRAVWASMGRMLGSYVVTELISTQLTEKQLFF